MPRRLTRLLVLPALFAVVACALFAPTTPPAITPTTAPLSLDTPMPPTPSAPAFRLIGYVSEWDAVVDEIPYDQLTHLNYAFLIPNADGTLAPLEHPEQLTAIVSAAHAHGVQVLISVGGWGWDQEFEQLAADDRTRAAFVAALLAFAADNDLDGIDLDWEYPGPARGSADNYLRLMTALAAGLRPSGRLLTAAVAAIAPSADDIQAEVFDQVDFLNLMAYDGPDANHASLEYAEAALAYWRGRGLPPEQMVLGVPFYGRPPEVAYRDLLAADPAAADQDSIEYNGATVYYNGRPTLIAKTALAQREASGIMIWALPHDAPGPASLLSAIYAAAHAAAPGPPAARRPAHLGW